MPEGRDASAARTADRVRGAAFAVVLLVGIGGRAHADAVESPPASCPRGSTPASSHAGPICRPRAECHGDATCAAGERCIALSFCIEIRDCGGLRPADDVCTLEHVVAECAEGVTCEFGPCAMRSVCAMPPAEAAPPAREASSPSAEPPGPSAAERTDARAPSTGGCCATPRAHDPWSSTVLGSIALAIVLAVARQPRGTRR